MLDQIPLQLEREGLNKREDGERGGLGGGGDYSREAIYRGTAIIRGNTLPEDNPADIVTAPGNKITPERE